MSKKNHYIWNNKEYHSFFAIAKEIGVTRQAVHLAYKEQRNFNKLGKIKKVIPTFCVINPEIPITEIKKISIETKIPIPTLKKILETDINRFNYIKKLGKNYNKHVYLLQDKIGYIIFIKPVSLTYLFEKIGKKYYKSYSSFHRGLNRFYYKRETIKSSSFIIAMDRIVSYFEEENIEITDKHIKQIYI